MFSERILDAFYNTENFDVIKGADGMGKTTCDIGSEIMKIYLKVDSEKVVDSKYQCFGGVIAIALCSTANSLLIGKTIAELKKFDASSLGEIVDDVPENKQYLVQLAVKTVLNAVYDCENGTKIEE